MAHGAVISYGEYFSFFALYCGSFGPPPRAHDWWVRALPRKDSLRAFRLLRHPTTALIQNLRITVDWEQNVLIPTQQKHIGELRRRTTQYPRQIVVKMDKHGAE
jgi:hypothetical protein